MVKHLVLVAGLLSVASAGAAQSRQTVVGVITDEICAGMGHSSMAMGPTDADCTRACVNAHGVRYVLFDGKTPYVLDDQKTPERFAGERVKVIGTVDVKTKTIHVQSIALSK